MIWIDLTEEVLRQRVLALAPLALGESYRQGWSPQEFIGALLCDACGAQVDLRAPEEGELSGWTTTGNRSHPGSQFAGPAGTSRPWSPASCSLHHRPDSLRIEDSRTTASRLAARKAAAKWEIPLAASTRR